MTSGPNSYTHTERLARAEQIAARFQAYYAENLLAIGIYGSLGRSMDGPYSDIEMHVIVKGEEIERSFEWSSGPWKAEVDVYSTDVFLAEAGKLDDLWPITQGSFARVLPLHDPKRLFHRAAHAVFDHTLEDYNRLIREVLIGDLYEMIGKARNALARGQTGDLAAEAVLAARYAACVVGLANRCLYSTGPEIFPESLGLPGRPAGYDELIEMVMRGELSDPRRVIKVMDTLWEGEEAWAAGCGLKLHFDLEELLVQD
jgi:kanamycin nucleotidyltransferase